MDQETCPVCGQPDDCGDCDHTGVMNQKVLTYRLFDQLSPHYESMNLKTRPGGDHLLVEWQEKDGRYFEAEIRVTSVCDCTAEYERQRILDFEDDDQAVGAYEMYGPDRPTWRELFPNE